MLLSCALKEADIRTIDQLLTQLEEQPKTIAALTAGVPHGRLHRSSSRGDWSFNDVVAHLRSCSDMWGKYIAAIVAEDHPTIRAMNPRTWIKQTDYLDLEFAPSLRAFTKQRAGLLALLRSLPKAGWARGATVTGAGRPLEKTVLDYAEWLADHERSHVKHLARMVEDMSAGRGSRSWTKPGSSGTSARRTPTRTS